MRKALYVLILIAGAAGTAAAQPAPNSEYTWGHRNGRYWNAASFAAKLGFLVGMSEGVRWIGPDSEKFVGTGTVGDGMKALDGFFADAKNWNFPILAAQSYLITKAKGELTPEQTESYLSIMRQRFVPGTMEVPNEPDESAEAEKPILPQRSKI